MSASSSSAAEVTPIRPGAATARPPRRRSGAAPLGPAPVWLSAPAKALWRTLIPAIDETFPELLSPLDTPALALMLEHYAIAQSAAGEMRGKGNVPASTTTEDKNHGGTKKAPASQVMRDHGKAFLELARDYGLTLGARSRIDLEKLAPVVPDTDDDDDLFDD